jgi:hypothetical protein
VKHRPDGEADLLGFRFAFVVSALPAVDVFVLHLGLVRSRVDVRELQQMSVYVLEDEEGDSPGRLVHEEPVPFQHEPDLERRPAYVELQPVAP